MMLDAKLAAELMSTTLGHVGRRYPYKLDLVLYAPEDLVTPRELHPIFHGSFDWHSCVHGWWQVLRLARCYPDLREAAIVRTRAASAFTPDNVAGEAARLNRRDGRTFERPYGWAWLLALDTELRAHEAPWRDALAPLAEIFADRFEAFLPKLDYPLRAGTHSNIAFALILTRHWARTHRPSLVALLDAQAVNWFADDLAGPVREPSADDFLSPTLTEAGLMANVLAPTRFVTWFDGFLPELPPTLTTPVIPKARSDGKLAHLDGLNLSRSWCLRLLSASLPSTHSLQAALLTSADRHRTASLSHIRGDYMGEHWLATFALLAFHGL